jgi:hypothetical protein
LQITKLVSLLHPGFLSKKISNGLGRSLSVEFWFEPINANGKNVEEEEEPSPEDPFPEVREAAGWKKDHSIQ